MLGRILRDIQWYSSEQLFGETITSIVRALGPDSPEELLLEYVLAFATAGVGTYIRNAIRLRRIYKWKKHWLAAARKSGAAKKIGNVAETLNKARRITAGEKILTSNRGRRGFDLLSYAGEGKEAKLLIDEVKDISGKVGYGRFKTLGADWSDEIRNAIGWADDALKENLSKKKITAETFETLRKQLLEREFTVRIVPGTEETIVTDEILEMIRKDIPRAKVLLYPLE